MEYQITIDGYIGTWNQSSRYIREVLKNYKGKHVDVLVSSMGGFVSDALNIYQQFKEHGDVTVYFQGFVASAATFLAMGAKEVKMSKYSLMLIHKCSSEQFVWDDMNEEQIGQFIKELQKTQQEQQKIDSVIANIYAEKSDKKHDEIIKMMSESKWLDSDECLNAGLVDEITDGTKIAPTDHTRKIINSMGYPAIPDFVVKNTEQKPSILQKLKNAISQKIKEMNKKWVNINGLLKIEGVDVDESKNCKLSEAQMQTIEDELTKSKNDASANEKKISDAAAEKNALEKQVADLKKEKSELENKVKTLEDEPGDETKTRVEDAQTGGLDLKKIGNIFKGIE